MTITAVALLAILAVVGLFVSFMCFTDDPKLALLLC